MEESRFMANTAKCIVTHNHLGLSPEQLRGLNTDWLIPCLVRKYFSEFAKREASKKRPDGL